MQDLTKITTPFGLLDAETQEALRAHGGPYEWYTGTDDGWADDENPDGSFNDGGYAVRVKPQPPKPREFWIRFSDEAVLPYVENPKFKDIGYIHVREVLE